MNSLENLILAYLENNPASSSNDVFDGLNATNGYATVKRCLIEEEELHICRFPRGSKEDRHDVFLFRFLQGGRCQSLRVVDR
jgi:hypothetical protein